MPKPVQLCEAKVGFSTPAFSYAIFQVNSSRCNCVYLPPVFGMKLDPTFVASKVAELAPSLNGYELFRLMIPKPPEVVTVTTNKVLYCKLAHPKGFACLHENVLRVFESKAPEGYTLMPAFSMLGYAVKFYP